MHCIALWELSEASSISPLNDVHNLIFGRTANQNRRNVIYFNSSQYRVSDSAYNLLHFIKLFHLFLLIGQN